MVCADQLPAGKWFSGRLQLHRRKKLPVALALPGFWFGKNICSVHPRNSDVMKIKCNFLIFFLMPNSVCLFEIAHLFWRTRKYFRVLWRHYAGSKPVCVPNLPSRIIKYFSCRELKIFSKKKNKHVLKTRDSRAWSFAELEVGSTLIRCCFRLVQIWTNSSKTSRIHSTRNRIHMLLHLNLRCRAYYLFSRT